MLWSKRERHPSRSPKSTYRPAQPPLPTISPRLPLAPLDPQSAASSSSQINVSTPSTSASSSSSSSLVYSATSNPDIPNIDIARPIISSRAANGDEDPPTKNGVASQTQGAPPSSVSLAQSDASREEGPSSTALPIYPPRRRTSLPSIHLRAASSLSSTASTTLIGSPDRDRQSPSPPSSDPQYISTDEIYLGLSTFTFGAAVPSGPSPSIPSFDPDMQSDAQISPLTPVPDSLTDRTPRPSVSIPHDSAHNHHINYLPQNFNAQLDPGPSLPPPPRRRQVPAPREEHISDSDDARVDPVFSDTASQHTFGGHGVNSSSASLSSFDTSSHSQTGFSSDDEMGAYRYDSFRSDTAPEPSPVTFASSEPAELDEDDETGIGLIPRHSYYGRRRSLPMAIPGAIPATDLGDSVGGEGRRDREASLTTLRRPSRSLDDEMRALNMGMGAGRASEPLSKGDWASLEARNDDGQTAYLDAGMNINYILGAQDAALSRRSSDALSFAQPARRPSQASQMIAFGWGWNGPPRRPSTATVGTSVDDTFTRHLRRWDEDYGAQKGFWSFKREKADGGSGRGLLSVKGRDGGEAARAKVKEREKEKEGGKVETKGMSPGSQEIWLCEYVGRFKVDRTTYKPDTTKPPHQRLNIRHILDPFSLGNTRGGPSVTIHKHSRAIAFSIYRAHNLVSHHRIRPGVLLAPKKVQERFTSTKTTAKLATHGLLEDDRGEKESRSAGKSVSRTSSMGRRDKEKEKKKAEERAKSKKEKDKDTNDFGSRPGSFGNVPSRPSELPGIPTAVLAPFELPTPSITLTSPSMVATDDLSSRRESISDQSTVKSLQADRRDSFDFDRPIQPTRTPHAETYGALDSSLIEYVRKRPDHLHRTAELDTGTSFFRRLLRPLPRSAVPGSGMTAGQTSAQLEGNYKPPWMAMAPRAKQEETDRVIHNLNNSFKGVGLLPANTKPPPKSKKGSMRSKTSEGVDLLESVPDDSLFMLLPLWPGETDPLSLTGHEATTSLAPVLEERNYLLVYYVPFDEREPERRKKRTRQTQTTSSHDGTRPPNAQDDRSIILTEFHVAARLIGYNELRGTGVRLPNDGLSVTGPLWEAAQFIPDIATRMQGHGDVVIAVYHSRERGVEFYPEGLVKMGLCMPSTEPTPDVFELGEDAEESTTAHLSPIGRAAVEMMWVGCMALSSFGPS